MITEYGRAKIRGRDVILVSIYKGSQMTGISYRNLLLWWNCDLRKTTSRGRCLQHHRLGKFGPRAITLEDLSKVSGKSVGVLKSSLDKKLIGTL